VTSEQPQEPFKSKKNNCSFILTIFSRPQPLPKYRTASAKASPQGNGLGKETALARHRPLQLQDGLRKATASALATALGRHWQRLQQDNGHSNVLGKETTLARHLQGNGLGNGLGNDLSNKLGKATASALAWQRPRKGNGLGKATGLARHRPRQGNGLEKATASSARKTALARQQPLQWCGVRPARCD
jgi:hypothetical protein